MEDKEEGLITDKMVGKVTWLVHKLAARRGADYQDVLAKCKKLFGYTNLAKVTIEDGHAIINKLIELTGGEEETEVFDAKDDLSPQEEETKDQEEETPQDEDLVTSTMRKAIRAAVDITNKEVVEKEVPVMGLGGFVLEIGKVIFEAKMAKEVKE